MEQDDFPGKIPRRFRKSIKIYDYRNQQNDQDIHDPHQQIDPFYQLPAVIANLLIVAAAHALADNGNDAVSYSHARQNCDHRNSICHRIGCDRRCSKSRYHAEKQQFPQLEHAVFDPVWDTDP